MNKLLVKATVFVILILISCITIEIMVRQIPNEYRYKKTYLDNNSDSIQILCLGASDCQNSFNPEYFSKNGFNMGNPGESIDISYEILKKYSNNLSNLEYIILAVSYPTLYSKMENSLESWRIKNYNIYYKINYSRNIKNCVEIFNGRLLDHVMRLYNYHVKKDKVINCTDKGWDIYYSTLPLDRLIKSGIHQAQRLTVPRNQISYGEMSSVLDSIVRLSQKIGSKILFCVTPVHSSFRENMDIHQYSNTINYFIQVTKENENCEFVDFLSDSRFINEDFYDGNHLNGYGAEKLSLALDSIIMR